MKAGMFDDQTQDFGFETQQDYEKALGDVLNPSWKAKLIRAISPSSHTAKVSKVMTALLDETTYKGLNGGVPDTGLFLKLLEQGAEPTTIDRATMTTLLKMDGPEIRPHIKNILNSVIEQDALNQAFDDITKENNTALELSKATGDEYEIKGISKADVEQAKAAAVIALFHAQYPYEKAWRENKADFQPMDESVATYLKEAIIENSLDMKRTFWGEYGDSCHPIVAKDFLRICDQPNHLSEARPLDIGADKEFLEVCIGSGMDAQHLSQVLNTIRSNAYVHGTDFVDTIYQAGVKPTDLLKFQSGWYGLNDDNGAITKHLLDNGATVSDVLATALTIPINQNQFDALWEADPIAANQQLIEKWIDRDNSAIIDNVLTMIEAKGVEPNFSRAHMDERLMLRQDDELHPYTEKLMNVLEKQGSLDQFKQEMLSYTLRHNDTDGIDNLIEKGAVLDDKTIRAMSSNYSEGDTYLVSIAHIVTRHNYKPTPAVKEQCKHDEDITKLFRNLETHDRLQNKLQPTLRLTQHTDQPIQAPKQKQSQKMKI
ncbi:TPA: hypothetical protein ACQVKY_005155 [Serratia marcescens]|uniref:Ankyrin repeat domain-containing protein n=1 Tax=Serratia nevei TaxID=2703794 RepID=A0ABT7G6B3_9GAMM|nr:hypothetical protein [Serratia nevei]HAU4290876.1 hypothetical protein [Serratia marcescens]MDK5169048.1 hypothetical protein [Serratia nevei]MDK5298542.1 hypothetical protein [Serratia nevei]MEC5887206.1 hypothetical protein [Serratia nevei]HAU4297470.1 hypothetical protein [Serratia marcescens]